MMNYRGYIGKVEYDDENRVFTGSVVNIKTVITFQGSLIPASSMSDSHRSFIRFF